MPTNAFKEQQSDSASPSSPPPFHSDGRSVRNYSQKAKKNSHSGIDCKCWHSGRHRWHHTPARNENVVTTATTFRTTIQTYRGKYFFYNTMYSKGYLTTPNAVLWTRKYLFRIRLIRSCSISVYLSEYAPVSFEHVFETEQNSTYTWHFRKKNGLTRKDIFQ